VHWLKGYRLLVLLEAWLGVSREAFPIIPRGLPRGMGGTHRFYSNVVSLGFRLCHTSK
jgi:hypothetical protein